MTSDNLQQWIRHPEMLNKETLYELRTLLACYPYFQTLRLLYLKNLFLLHDITFGLELRKAALYVADRRILFYLIEGDKYILRAPVKEVLSMEIEDEPCLDRTLSLIDSFLSTVPEETVAQTTLDYSTDYTSYLLQSDDLESVTVEGLPTETPRLRGSEWIDGFIEKSEGELSPKTRTFSRELSSTVEVDLSSSEDISTDEDDDSCFTETLAKIYVKQQRYSKALEIIKKLSLKYPKKNAYFADQIRFLEKLIINANSK